MKIVISLMPKSMKDAKALLAKDYSQADLLEWRADFLPYEEVLEVAPLIFQTFSDFELIFTLRTVEEGGNLSVSEADYLALIQDVAKHYQPAYLDVQYFSFPKAYQALAGRDNLVLSYHNFECLPKDLDQRLTEMTACQPAVVKAAVMPMSEADVLTLMQTTRSFKNHFPEQTFVTMAMGSVGRVSRLAGDLFGSAWTFASLKKASAPGQVALKDVLYIREVLDGD